MREDISNFDATPIGVALSGIGLFEGKAPAPSKELQVRGVQVKRGQFVNGHLLEKDLQPFLSKPISVRLLEEVRRAILDFYGRRGYLVSVPISDQEATSGVFQFGVTFRRWRKISVEGSPKFNTELYKRPFASLIDLPVTGDALSRHASSLERNPFRTVTYIPYDLQDPNDLGATGLRLNVVEKFPLSLTASVDNQGVPILGEERYSLALTTTDPFHLDHVIQYRFITADDPRKQTAHYLTYLLPSPLNYQHTIQISGIYSESKAKTLASGAEITNTGKSAQLTLSYAIPLPRLLDLGNQELTLGIDYKSSDSNFDFGGTTFSQTGTETYQSWIAHNFSLDFNKEKWIRSGGISNRIIFSPGGIGNKNNDIAYQTIRAGSSANYIYWRADFSSIIAIPDGLAASISNSFLRTLASGTLLSLTATTQVTTDNLLPAEQLSFGGADSVRGFEENAQLVDEGFLLRAELYAPPFMLLGGTVKNVFTSATWLQDQARPFLFFDYGGGRAKRARDNEENNFALGAVGLGITYSLNSRLTAKVSYGWQVIERHFEDDKSGRLHFEIALAW